MRVRLSVVGLVLVLSATIVRADEKAKIPVAIAVTCDDEEIKSELTSYVGRELRSISDVQLHVSPPEEGRLIKLELVAIRTCVQKAGIAMSYAVWQRGDKIRVFITSGVHTGPRDQLKGMAESLVADFDSGPLNQWRRSDEIVSQLMEALKKKNEKQDQ